MTAGIDMLSEGDGSCVVSSWQYWQRLVETRLVLTAHVWLARQHHVMRTIDAYLHMVSNPGFSSRSVDVSPTEVRRASASLVLRDSVW